MKIIKHAKKQETKQYRAFVCKNCGCEFHAEEGEYWEKPQTFGDSNTISYSPYKYYMTCCPECHKIVQDAVYDSNLAVTLTDKQIKDFGSCTTVKKDDLVTETIHVFGNSAIGKTESSWS